MSRTNDYLIDPDEPWLPPPSARPVEPLAGFAGPARCVVVVLHSPDRVLSCAEAQQLAADILRACDESRGIQAAPASNAWPKRKRTKGVTA